MLLIWSRLQETPIPNPDKHPTLDGYFTPAWVAAIPFLRARSLLSFGGTHRIPRHENNQTLTMFVKFYCHVKNLNTGDGCFATSSTKRPRSCGPCWRSGVVLEVHLWFACVSYVALTCERM